MAAARPQQRRPAAGDATLVYDRGKGRRPGGAEPPRLVVTAGPGRGTEHVLRDDSTTIGRGPDNVLVIPDISVSRKHARLERQGERWMVFDQGSENGTRVNGRRVERRPLQHGDEIGMGDTTVQFVEPGGVLVRSGTAAAPGSPRLPAGASGLRRRGPLYGAILLALAIVLAAGLVRRRQRLRAAAEEEQGDESRAFARKRFQEGLALLGQGRWVEARDRLEIAAQLDDQDAEIRRSLESAEAEAPRARQLSAARLALLRRDYRGAREALSGIPDDSAVAGSARELSLRLQAALDSAVRAAKARLEAGQPGAAQELLEPVLRAEPARSDALAVKAAIAARRRASAGVRRKPAVPPIEAAGKDEKEILDAYLSSDVSAAIALARKARSPAGERLLAEIEEFEAAYRDGVAHLRADRAADALSALDRAAAADREIAQGRDSQPGREARTALSLLHYRAGAAQASSEDTLPGAAAHLRVAVEDDPGNEPAQALLRQIGDRCQEIYLRGYAAKDQDAGAARTAFALVVETLPASDETAQKARRWLDRLDGKPAEGE